MAFRLPLKYTVQLEMVLPVGHFKSIFMDVCKLKREVIETLSAVDIVSHLHLLHTSDLDYAERTLNPLVVSYLFCVGYRLNSSIEDRKGQALDPEEDLEVIEYIDSELKRTFRECLDPYRGFLITSFGAEHRNALLTHIDEEKARYIIRKSPNPDDSISNISYAPFRNPTYSR